MNHKYHHDNKADEYRIHFLYTDDKNDYRLAAAMYDLPVELECGILLKYLACLSSSSLHCHQCSMYEYYTLIHYYTLHKF